MYRVPFLTLTTVSISFTISSLLRIDDNLLKLFPLKALMKLDKN